MHPTGRFIKVHENEHSVKRTRSRTPCFLGAIYHRPQIAILQRSPFELTWTGFVRTGDFSFIVMVRAKSGENTINLFFSWKKRSSNWRWCPGYILNPLPPAQKLKRPAFLSSTPDPEKKIVCDWERAFHTLLMVCTTSFFSSHITMQIGPFWCIFRDVVVGRASI